MRDAALTATAIGAGALVGTAVFVACGGGTRVGAAADVVARNAIDRVLLVRRARARLAVDLDRAGWRESPERICVFALALAACLAVLGATTISKLTTRGAVLMCGTWILVGPRLPFVALMSAIARRPTRRPAELVPL